MGYYYFVVFFGLIPIVKVLRRVGYSGWWCLIALIPLVGLIGLWVFAYARWPNLDRTQ